MMPLLVTLLLTAVEDRLGARHGLGLGRVGNPPSETLGGWVSNPPHASELGTRPKADPLLANRVVRLDRPEPPPLTEEQRAAVQKLVQSTREEMTRLRGLLDEKQRALARRYADFDLDTAAVEKLQKEIVDIQKQLLDRYHAMQVDLRRIVGKERFVVLRQRIDAILNPMPKKEK